METITSGTWLLVWYLWVMIGLAVGYVLLLGWSVLAIDKIGDESQES